jgi:hypothetical protein
MSTLTPFGRPDPIGEDDDLRRSKLALRATSMIPLPNQTLEDMKRLGKIYAEIDKSELGHQLSEEQQKQLMVKIGERLSSLNILERSAKTDSIIEALRTPTMTLDQFLKEIDPKIGDGIRKP